MINRVLPVGTGKRFALRIGDRHDRHFAKFFVQGHQVGKIEPAMQGCHMWNRVSTSQREMNVIGMKVNNVKTRRPLEHLFEHNVVMSKRVKYIVETQGSSAPRYQLRRSDRVAAGEESDLVSLPHQLLSQIGNYPLGAAIGSRRHTLVQRGHLRNCHATFPRRDDDAARRLISVGSTE